MFKIATVLIVDDDNQIRRILARMLTNAGYEVCEARNGHEAIASYRGHPVDVVITDMYMPEGDGVDVIMRIRSDFPKAKFIAISGGGVARLSSVLDAARDAGALAALPKPFTKEALLHLLSDCLTPVGATYAN